MNIFYQTLDNVPIDLSSLSQEIDNYVANNLSYPFHFNRA